MRRADRETTKEEAWEILAKGEFGVLSMVDEGLKPYAVPLHYCLVDGALYFHSAVEGKKLDVLAGNAQIAFSVVGQTEVMSSKFTAKYESCLVRGKAEEVFDEEKERGLKGLVEKYSSSFMEKGDNYIRLAKDKTRVVKITITEISGKARR